MQKPLGCMAAACLLAAAGCTQAGDSALEERVVKRLPNPDIEGTVPVETTISNRRSVRVFAPDPLTPAQISQLLWAAQGITDRRRGFRSAPSAGATFPLAAYLISADGVFLYNPAQHEIELRDPSDVRDRLAAAALGQSFVRSAPVSIVLTALFERTTGRYGKRGEQYVYMEAGHAAQNVHLQAVAMGLGSVPVGAFDDGAVAGALGLTGREKPLYILPVGVPGSP